jgi:serine/arginine repetitive matrix protein 2
MYNGIGLSTTRGTGTNGYVTKNLSFVRLHKDRVEYKPDEESKKLEAFINRKGNAELLKHGRKRNIELKCAEMEDLMAEQGYRIVFFFKYEEISLKIIFYSYKEEEIARKVEKFRKQLMEKDALKDGADVELAFEEYGRPT